METVRKYSRKRQALLDAIKCTREHPSAEMLYSSLKPEHPDLSLGTVYRNLAMFVQDGNIVSVGCVAGQERYDGNVTPHPHFICSVCGRVLDLTSLDIASGLDGQVERETGARVTGHSLSFSGVCADCLDKTDS